MSEEKKEVPACQKCGSELTLTHVEAIVAPPAPTMYLNKYKCESCPKGPSDLLLS